MSSCSETSDELQYEEELEELAYEELENDERSIKTDEATKNTEHVGV